jgi:hypothetical protein
LFKRKYANKGKKMNHLAPIPCAHCGTNFMRRDIHPDAPKLCNNCSIKDQIRNPKQEIKLEKVKLLIEVDRETQIEIEELCTNLGISISDYLVSLHKTNTSTGYLYCGPEILDSEMKKFHKESESKANEPTEDRRGVTPKKPKANKK